MIYEPQSPFTLFIAQCKHMELSSKPCRRSWGLLQETAIRIDLETLRITVLISVYCDNGSSMNSVNNPDSFKI